MAPRGLTPEGHRHAEAFCLMWYRCQSATCQSMVRIWNSRDGVTPFGMVCPSCGDSNMLHAYFGSDTYAPEHQLNHLQYFWRDGTKDEWRAIFERNRRIVLDEYQRDYPMSLVDEQVAEALTRGEPYLDVYRRPGDCT